MKRRYRARKQHECRFCSTPINPGEVYERVIEFPGMHLIARDGEDDWFPFTSSASHPGLGLGCPEPAEVTS